MNHHLTEAEIIQLRTELEHPKRVQLSRKKGWRLPPNTMSVARPGKWGNPFKVGETSFYVCDHDDNDRIIIATNTVRDAVAQFKWLARQDKHRERIVRELRGKNLACWCPLDQPCHADVLLEIANGEPAQ